MVGQAESGRVSNFGDRGSIEIMRSMLVSVTVLVLCSISTLAARPKQDGPPPVRRLPVPKDVSPQEDRELRAYLGQHATAMQNLVHAVVLLDRPTVKILADRIVDAQIFERGEKANLRALSLVDAEAWGFKNAVRELSFVASTSKSDDLVADRFAVVARACVLCHGHYLHGPRNRNPVDWEPMGGEQDPSEEQPNEASPQTPQP